MLGQRYRTLVPMLIIFAAVVLVYSNTLHSPFQWDENVWLATNPFVADIHYPIREIGKTDPELHKHLINRVVGFLTFALNYRMHGFRVEGYHIFNLAIHLLNSLLVYILIVSTTHTRFFRGSALGRDRSVAFIAGLLFAVHPINTEAVNYIFQRVTLLATTFCLLSLMFYVKSRSLAGQQAGLGDESEGTSPVPHHRALSWTLYCLSLLSAVLAMKTKETAFTLPFVIALYDFSFFEGRARKRLIRLAPILLTSFIIPFTYLFVMDMDVDRATRGMGIGASRLSYLFTEFRVIATYIRLLFVPVNQNLDYDYPYSHSFLEPGVTLSFLLLSSVIAAGLYLLRKGRKADSALRLAGFGVVWFFVTLSVESSLMPQPNVINEYRLYMPSIGFFTSMATVVILMSKGVRSRLMLGVLSACAAVTLALYVFAAYQRNALWSEGTSLWKDTVAKSPEKSRPHNNLGVAYVKKAAPGDAIREFRTAIRLDPGNMDAYKNLCNIYAALGCIDEYMETYTAALRIDPAFSVPRVDEITREHGQGRMAGTEAAADVCRSADDDAARKAIRKYETLVRTNPGDAEAHYNLGNLYMGEGLPDKAATEYEAAIKLRPEYVEAHNNLAGAYLQMGRFAEAGSELQTVLKLAPDLQDARNNLDFVSEMMKKFGKKK